MKKKTKKIVKKASKKAVKTVKKAKQNKVKSQELVIKVQPMNQLPSVVKESDIIEPINEGKKLAITKTWVSNNQIMRMVQKTPAQHIYTRPGKGGKKWDYVTGNYVEKVLNYVFGFMWDFEILSEGVVGDFIWVKGKLTVKNADGQTITKSQFGRKEIAYGKDKPHKPENMLDYGNDLKSAATDALKKCASMLGIASDIYGKMEYKNEADKRVVETNEVQILKDVKTVEGPEGEPVIVCVNCDSIVDEKVAAFSKKVFGKVLCRECQPKRN